MVSVCIGMNCVLHAGCDGDFKIQSHLGARTSTLHAYGCLHELRAIVPEGTPYLACTATATKSIREEVIRSLDMYDSEFVFTSPDRPNIFYEVRPRTDIDYDMKPFVCSLKNTLLKHLGLLYIVSH